MRTAAPPLAGVLRGDMQFALLGELAADDGSGLSITELASRVGAHYSSVHGEVERLHELGIVTDQRVGRTRLVRLAEGVPWLRPLRQMLLMTYGPLPVLRDALQDLPYVVQSFIFGSWARRFAGEDGPAPQDVDVLVVFDPEHVNFPEEDTLELYRVLAAVNERVGQANVQATLVPVGDWVGQSSAFADRVRQGPTVALLGESYGEVSS